MAMNYSAHKIKPVTLGYARTLRKTMTSSEKKLWKVLRDRKFHNYKFRRQVPLQSFIVDFACMESRLIIEVDGISHEFRKAYDVARQKIIEDLGFTILRFRNSEINKNMDWVLEVILHMLLIKDSLSRRERARVRD